LFITIFDWKNTKKLREFAKERGYGPCKYLMNCNYQHYSIQQNIYKYLFETYYKNWTFNGHFYNNVKVERMALVIVHDNLTKARAVEIRDCTHIIQEMVHIRELELKDLIQKSEIPLQSTT